GWTLRPRPHFSPRDPLHLLGRVYTPGNGEDLAQFRRDFHSRLWLTYRSGFPALPGTPRTTDCGWGCTLRSAQMLLGQGLILHLLGRGKGPPKHRERPLKHRGDPSARGGNPKTRGGPLKTGGDPKTRGGPLKTRGIPEPGGGPQNLKGTPETWLVRGEPELGTAGSGMPGSGQRRAVVLLVPVRLGGESLNPVYVECVKELLQLRSCLGIVGGKPRHSLYFLGFQGDSLLYLDPHYCQPCVDMARENFPLQSFHCRFPRKMPFGKMDPSCTFGFYASGTELEELCRDLAQVRPPRRVGGGPFALVPTP
ncbi:ATG4D protease, partial [Sclerurus mexicanus]|nr:ATG4D protease [Sclerurus mexicanus]